MMGGGCARHAQPCINTHIHWRASCMGVAPCQCDFQPPKPLPMGNHANVMPFGFEYRPLFDVELEYCMHFSRSYGLITYPTNAFQFITK